MAKRLTEKDKQWLKDHPNFHVVGRTWLGKHRNTKSDGSHVRAENENDQHVYEMHRTLSRRLEEYEAYQSMIEDRDDPEDDL